MKNSEIIKKYWDKILEAMVEGYRFSLETAGRTESHIMVAENGDIRIDEHTHSDNWRYLNDDHTFIVAVGEEQFDWKDYGCETEKDAIDESVAFYESVVEMDLEDAMNTWLETESYEEKGWI